jgi:hypothetical protein
MWARDQIDYQFRKFINQEPDIPPFSIMVQLIDYIPPDKKSDTSTKFESRPFPSTNPRPPVMVSDGLTKIELHQPYDALRNLRGNSHTLLSDYSVRNSMVMLKDVEFFVCMESMSAAPKVVITARDSLLLMPGNSLDIWGKPVHFNVRTKTVFIQQLTNVSNLIS